MSPWAPLAYVLTIASLLVLASLSQPAPAMQPSRSLAYSLVSRGSAGNIPHRPCVEALKTRKLAMDLGRRRITTSAEGTAEGDLEERLRKAEAEAAALRAKLAETETDKSDLDIKGIQEELQKTEKFIQNTNPLKRGGRQGNDMAGPSEAELIRELGLDTSDKSEEIKRRIFITFGGSALLGALAFVPTNSHKVPKEPASVFLAPVIRSQFILDDVRDAIDRRLWKRELSLVHQILDKPNYLRKNVLSAAQALPSDEEWRSADGLAREIVENIRALDYQEFFQTEEPTADQVGFLEQGVQECLEKINDFLNMMKPSEVTAARLEAERTKSAVSRDNLDYKEIR
eukprot:CAMPEP_0114509534 /NCGR_PEP_ID=MMETSP0109-20121206/13268_1 /TAXON_ID=29199 /ORGANISM="Chlorarachnion reptans, Strain CCCM449" /LENGTH=342 /DNA_ID=CAMNT_0001688707 /DNA_START=360 /DNA_END=1388 /DNA_ORIENTATION=+